MKIFRFKLRRHNEASGSQGLQCLRLGERYNKSFRRRRIHSQFPDKSGFTLRYNRLVRVGLIATREDMMMEKSKSKAPDADVRLADGSQKRLRDFWQSQTLVLVFLRHFG
jgi:hypothetical protein